MPLSPSSFIPGKRPKLRSFRAHNCIPIEQLLTYRFQRGESPLHSPVACARCIACRKVLDLGKWQMVVDLIYSLDLHFCTANSQQLNPIFLYFVAVQAKGWHILVGNKKVPLLIIQPLPRRLCCHLKMTNLFAINTRPIKKSIE